MNPNWMSFGEPSEDKACHCIWCKWEGTLKDAKKTHVNSSPESWRSLGGREGFEWKCPKCGFTVHHWYWKMS